MYLTYEEYQQYGGTLDETTFADYEFEAECVINWYTFNRLKNEDTYPEEVKRCMYRLIALAKLKADALQLGSQTTTITKDGTTTTVTTEPVIQSQSNDGVSISYNVMSASDIFDMLASKSKGSEVDLVIQRCLQGVVNSLGRKVLYRGLYPNE